MKRIVVLFIVACIGLSAQAQNQNKTISGTVIEKSNSLPIESVSIRILAEKDSSYITGTITDTKGKFAVKVKPDRYIVEVSFMGFTTQFLQANVRDKNTNLGAITMSENGVLLGEAVITAKAIDIQVKGDTVEYNADSYKVQESAVLEDLLKKMPGVEVDSDGKITVNGKEVKKMLVDGKEFFSDDPKVASKNLPASMIDKLQVLDKKSDLAELTGFDDGEEETVINLTVKPGMKQGTFGNAFAGYGTEKRYEAGAIANYMRNNTQITAIGGVNNTNNAGFSDFTSSMFSGRQSRGGMRFGGNNGIAKTINGGLNFATEHSDKFKWGGDIQFGSVDNEVSSTSSTRYINESGRSEESISWGENKNLNFAASMRFEWNPDKATTIIFRPNIRYGTSDNVQFSETEAWLSSGDYDRREGNSSYTSNGKNLNLRGSLNVSRKLGDKGRTLSMQLSGGYTDSDDDGFDYSYIKNFNSITNLFDERITDQQFFQKDKSNNWRAFLSYVEPLGRNNFLQLTYNIRNSNSNTDKEAFKLNPITNSYTELDEAYTRKMDNSFLNQNISLNFKAIREKYDYTIGLGLEPSSTKTSSFEPGKQEIDTPRKNFLSFAPNAQFNYKWDRRHNLRIDYRGSTNQPSTLQLYDGIVRTTATDTVRGNINLRPSFENRIMLRYQNFNPEKGSTLMAIGRFSATSNDIVSVTDWVDGSKNTSYENINGNMEGNLRVMMNLPFRNRNFSFSSMSFGSFKRSNSFTSEENAPRQKNRSDNFSLTENAGFTFRSDLAENNRLYWLLRSVDFGLRGNIRYQDISYSITKAQNKEVFNFGGSAQMTLFFQKDFTLETDISYSANSGYSDGFKQKEWMWNASISKDIFKDKSGTIRIKAYDILQQRSNISRTMDVEKIEDITSSTINSYVMVNFIYRFQSFKGGAKRTDMEGNRGDRPRPPHGVMRRGH